MGCQKLFGKRAIDPSNPPLLEGKKTGWCGHKKVISDYNSSSNGCPITAIAVGALFFLAMGGFGAIGFAHSSGLISLPKWLTPAFNAITQSPTSWQIWIVGSGGIAVQVTLVTFGLCKVYSCCKEGLTTKQNSEEPISREELISQFVPLPLPDQYAVNLSDYEEMPNLSYFIGNTHRDDGNDYFIAINASTQTENKHVLFSAPLNEEMRDELIESLRHHSFTPYEKK